MFVAVSDGWAMRRAPCYRGHVSIPLEMTSVLSAVAIGAVGVAAASWLAGVTDRAAARLHLDPVVRRLLVMGVRPTVWCIAVIMALPLVGIGPESILTVLAGASLSVGLALRDHLSNVASGAVLLTLRPYHIGDLVTLGLHEGRVTRLGLFETVLARQDGAEVLVRNDLAIAGAIVNHTRLGQRRVDVDVHVGWAADLGVALDLLRTALAERTDLHAEPAPTVFVEALPHTGPVVRVRAWCDPEAVIAVRAAVALDAARAVAGLPHPSA
jgi:small conductance mechanosensitive channel